MCLPVPLSRDSARRASATMVAIWESENLTHLLFDPILQLSIVRLQLDL